MANHLNLALSSLELIWVKAYLATKSHRGRKESWSFSSHTISGEERFVIIEELNPRKPLCRCIVPAWDIIDGISVKVPYLI